MSLVYGEALFDVFLDKDRGAAQCWPTSSAGAATDDR
jgi:hypothetical protein